MEKVLCLECKNGSLNYYVIVAKIVICLFLWTHTLSVYGQQVKTIALDAGSARSVNLSEISEKITPVILEKSPGIILNGHIILINEYLFITAMSSIEQYDLTGKFIRSIDCGGYITYNVTGDSVKRELYVPVGNIIKCYDFFGKLIKEYRMENRLHHVLYCKGHLCVLLYSKQQNNEFIYSVSKINLSAGEIIRLYDVKNRSVYSGAGRLTRYDDNVAVSFSYYDNFLYAIQQDETVPIVHWTINPPAKSASDGTTLRSSGFSGHFLFIHYRRDDRFYVYLENMKTGETYNAGSIVDDVFYTHNPCMLHPLNQQGYFFYAKDKHEITGNSIGNKPLKNSPVIFIVKMK